MTQLIWNGSDYQAELEGGKMLFVNGDDFAEEKLSMATANWLEAHPGASKEDFANAEDCQQFIAEAKDELLDADSWMHCADGSDNAAAWIKTK